MMADLGTVLWKEWREILSWVGSRGKAGILIFLGVFGVFMPLEVGRAWVESPAQLAYWAWVPMLLVISVIADTFAGERERHTLETLLASRLPDRAILLGKVAAAVGYGMGLTWLGLLLGLVTANFTVRQRGLLLYSPTVALEILGLNLTFSMLAASGGALVSLRAATVRQAQQTLSIALMVLVFVPVFGSPALPREWKARVLAALMAMDTTLLVVLVVAILAVVDVALLIVAMARFRRTVLTLD